MLSESYFSRQPPCLGLACGFLACSCGLWSQRQLRLSEPCAISVCLAYPVLPGFPLVPSAAAFGDARGSLDLLCWAGLRWGPPIWWCFPASPEVSGEGVECQAPGDTEASWTGTLVTGSLFLVLLTHPNPRNALTWLTKIKHYTFSYFK